VVLHRLGGHKRVVKGRERRKRTNMEGKNNETKKKKNGRMKGQKT
jgi:hypothetical protein